MTLILSLATPHFAVTVADRRLTWTDGRIADDDANKLVMFCDRMVFAYTGVAQLEGKKTDVWLTDEFHGLPDRSLERACNHVTARSTEAFRRQRTTWGKLYPHSFVGVGFTPKTETTEVRPLFIRISNEYDEAGNLRETPADYFIFVHRAFENHVYAWNTGWPLERSESVGIVRRLRKAVKVGTGPAPAIRTFQDVIRGVSTRLGNQWVGKSLLAVALPKPPDSPDGGFTLLTTTGDRAGLLSKPVPQFYALPEDATSLVHYGPNFACPGGSSVTSFRFTGVRR